jgi:hypothetical protein
MDMKILVTAAILTLALGSTAALAQVYGGEDDPYQQNPFASNVYVPPAPDAAAATPAPSAPAPATTTPAQNTGKTQQTTASSANPPAKLPAQP